MTFKLVRARDQTRLSCGFVANTFSGSGDNSYTNKKVTDSAKNRTLRSSLRVVTKTVCGCSVSYKLLFAVACDSEKFADSFDYSNYMHRAVARVAYKFAHELPLYDILLKVDTMLLCDNLISVTVTVNTSLCHCQCRYGRPM